MSSTIRAQILDALEAKLRELSDVTVKVNTGRPSSSARLPLLIMLDGDDDRDESGETTGADLRVTGATIEGYVSAETATGLRSAREYLIGRLREKLLEDLSLGGLAIDLTIEGLSVVPTDEEGHPHASNFSQDVQIQYMADEGDPFALGP